MRMQINYQRAILLAAVAMSMIGAVIVWATDPQPPKAADSLAITPDSALSERLVVTYFHGNARCVTCRKMEAYAKEAIDSNLASRLADGTIEWRTVNFDEDGNDHFLKDYQLFGQALILSWVKDGKEVEWKNLDQIWQVVRDKEKYLAYVEQEVNAFLEQRKK